MMVRVVVHVRRSLTNMYVGLIGSVNDFWVFWEIGLYKQTQEKGLLIWKKVIKKVSIHLFLATRLSIVVWIMTLHNEGQHFFLELFYNIKHKCEHSMIENAFNSLKKSFKEILCKMDANTFKGINNPCWILVKIVFTFLYMFLFWHSKIMIIISSCAKWLIWVLRNSN
jgi:hypothetical protein